LIKSFFTSMTRIAKLRERAASLSLVRLPHAQWESGDYVVGEIVGEPGTAYPIELYNGRMIPVAEGDWVLGAFGKRAATLEATGDWEKIGEDGRMTLLTGAGLFGKLVSKSNRLGRLNDAEYLGHVWLDGKKARMRDFVTPAPAIAYDTPTVLLIGTSMSAGKTTAATIIVRRLKQMGLKVVGAKLAGAGRYRDTLWVLDAGADDIFDFMDVGLPSTVCPESDYREAVDLLLRKMAGVRADAAVVELGASPLEPYNGSVAVEAIAAQVKCALLCASDPYAALGVKTAYGKLQPDLITGPAANTDAGVALIEKLCRLPALDLLEKKNLPALDAILRQKLALG